MSNDKKYRIEVRQSKRGQIVRSYWVTESELNDLVIGQFTSVYERRGKRMYKIN